MASKLSGLGRGAAAGAGLGAGLGSIVGPWGTAIGGAVGAIGGGIAGLVSADDADDEEKKALEQQQADDELKRQQALADAESGGAHAKERAFQSFIMQEAGRRGANPTLLARRGLDVSNADTDWEVARQKQQIDRGIAEANAAAAAQREDNFDPMALAPLAAAAGNIGQGFYKAGQTTPFFLQKDTAVSPEVQDQFNDEDWKPLRQGKRLGYGES